MPKRDKWDILGPFLAIGLFFGVPMAIGYKLAGVEGAGLGFIIGWLIILIAAFSMNPR